MSMMAYVACARVIPSLYRSSETVTALDSISIYIQLITSSFLSMVSSCATMYCCVAYMYILLCCTQCHVYVYVEMRISKLQICITDHHTTTDPHTTDPHTTDSHTTDPILQTPYYRLPYYRLPYYRLPYYRPPYYRPHITDPCV